MRGLVPESANQEAAAVIKFVYFDLGNVLVHFTVERMLRQVGAAAGVDAECIREVVYRGGLQTELECGRITSREFYDRFCLETGTRADYETLELAASDIFDLNVSILPILTGLSQAGGPMGILSNTCAMHWEHCRRRFSILQSLFGTFALSYLIGTMKPDAAIFQAAAELAGCRPAEILYFDDMPQHVEGARTAGFDAVQFTSAPQLRAELRRRELPEGRK